MRREEWQLHLLTPLRRGAEIAFPVRPGCPSATQSIQCKDVQGVPSISVSGRAEERGHWDPTPCLIRYDIYVDFAHTHPF